MAPHKDPAQQTHGNKIVTAADHLYFEDKLRTRLAVLRSSILNTLSQSGSEEHIKLAGQVHDAKDDAFFDLMSEVDAALMSHETAEVRDIESARQRLQQGVYGRCTDCGATIEWRRLDAYPSAPCCVACQERREHPSGAAR